MKKYVISLSIALVALFSAGFYIKARLNTEEAKKAADEAKKAVEELPAIEKKLENLISERNERMGKRKGEKEEIDMLELELINPKTKNANKEDIKKKIEDSRKTVATLETQITDLNRKISQEKRRIGKLHGKIEYSKMNPVPTEPPQPTEQVSIPQG